MKKLVLMLAAVATMFAAKPARADGSLSDLWNDFKSSATAHLLDNATPGYFYDFKSHTQMGGITTELYTYKQASLDAGVIKSIQGSSGVPQPLTHVVPIANIDFHVGSYLNQIPEVNSLVSSLGLNSGVLQYVHIGGWAGKDLTSKEYLYGLSGGIRVQFK